MKGRCKMQHRLTINILVNDDPSCVEAMDITEGIYDRTEFVAEEIDKPITLKEATLCIQEYLLDNYS